MFIKSVEVLNNDRKFRLDYIHDNRKSKTLREKLAVLDRNIQLTHIVGSVEIFIKDIANCKILATLNTGAVVDLTEAYNVNEMLDSLDAKNSLGEMRYGDSIVFINHDHISIITSRRPVGGYIGTSKKCLYIPWILNLKRKLYIEDHREWLT